MKRIKFRLLTQNNMKMEKTHKKGFNTFILHLSPARNSGINVCKWSTVGCRAACLNTAGYARLGIGLDEEGLSSIERCRRRKTRLLFEDRDTFMALLIKDIRKAIEKLGTVAIRLNGTSDILWENMEFTFEGKQYPNIMKMFPKITFYDYTKYPSNERPKLPKNYHLTFSLSERPGSWEQSLEWRERGVNTAVVFNLAKSASLPDTFKDYPMVDGDLHDARFSDPKGVIVGLRAKHMAQKDRKGFVVKSIPILQNISV